MARAAEVGLPGGASEQYAPGHQPASSTARPREAGDTSGSRATALPLARGCVGASCRPTRRARIGARRCADRRPSRRARGAGECPRRRTRLTRPAPTPAPGRARRTRGEARRQIAARRHRAAASRSRGGVRGAKVERIAAASRRARGLPPLRTARGVSDLALMVVACRSPTRPRGHAGGAPYSVSVSAHHLRRASATPVVVVEPSAQQFGSVSIARQPHQSAAPRGCATATFR